ncbi:MAG: GNAT family N-acetyltransferase [Gemmatimonadales bacterium]
MRVRLVRNPRELAELLPAWSDLFAGDPRGNARNAPHLVTAFHQMFRPAVAPLVFVVHDRHDRVCGVLPLGLMRQRVGPIILRRLVPLIHWHAYGLDAVIVHDDAQAIGDALRHAIGIAGWDQLALRHLRPDSWLLDPEVAPFRDIDSLNRSSGIPSAHIALPREVVLRGRSGANMAERERKFLASGSIESGWQPVGEGFREAVAEFIEMHGALKTMQQQTTTFRYGTAARDFPGWLLAEARAGRARLFTIRRDGAMVAASVVLVSHGVGHSYRVAWAPALGEFGLGILQTTRLIEACSAQGDQTFDMGPGAEPYKLKWHPELTTLVDLTAIRPTWRVHSANQWLRLRGRPPLV